MRHQIETVGWGLIAYGLSLVLLVVLTAVVRSDDAPWQAFAWLYGFAWVMVFVGFKILNRVGAWPVSSRPGRRPRYLRKNYGGLVQCSA